MSRDLDPTENETRPSSRWTWHSIVVLCTVVAGLVGWTKYTVSLTTAHHQAVEDQHTALRNEQLATVERDLALTSIQSMVVELHNKLDGDPRQSELEQAALEIAMEALASKRSAGDDIAAAESASRIGELYLRLDRIDNAEENLQRSAKICREILKKRQTTSRRRNVWLRRYFISAMSRRLDQKPTPLRRNTIARPCD